MSKITVTTIAGLTSGSDANKVKIESGDTLEVVSNATVGGTLGVTGASTFSGNIGKVSSGLSPEIDIHVKTASGNPEVRVESTGANYATYGLKNSSRVYSTQIRTDQSNAYVVRDETAGANRLLIDTSGHITAPNQPAFQAQLTNTYSNFPVNTDNTIPFGTERFDNNADYNTSTYTFTAPVTGKYQLNVHLLVEGVQNTPNYYQVQLTTSNKVYYETFDPRGFDTTTSYLCLQSSPLADMDANDTAKVIIHQQAGNATSDLNATTCLFNGYLVVA